MFGRSRIARSEPLDPRDPSDRLTIALEDAKADLFGPSNGTPMTPWELPIVVSCRQVIADTVAQLPLVAVRGTRARDDQPTVIRRPDPDEPRWLTLQRCVNSLTRHGRFFLQATSWDAAGYPLSARVVTGDEAVPVFEPVTGRVEAVIHNGRRHPAGPDGLVWVPMYVDHAGDYGTAPLRRCWRAAEHLTALWDMAGSFWHAGFPSVAVQVAHRLSPDQRGQLKSQLLTSWARRHEPAVIDNDGRLTTIGANAVESQLVETIGVANVEIARAHSVAPSIVNVAAGDSLTYATTETETQRWLALGLGHYLTRLESGFAELLPYGNATRFDTSELTRADMRTRIESYQTALGGSPWLTVDEVRVREGLDPHPQPDHEVSMQRDPLTPDAGGPTP